MTNEMASEILMKKYKCCTESCAALNCEDCAYYNTKNEQTAALLFASKALETKAFDNWLPSALMAIRSGVADKLSKDNVTAYKIKNIIRLEEAE